MPPSLTSGSSIIVSSRTPMSTLAFAMDQRARHSQYPAIRFTRGTISRLHRFATATACQVAGPPCTDLTDLSANGGFYFQAFNGSVTLPAAGYNYNSDWVQLSSPLFFLRQFLCFK